MSTYTDASLIVTPNAYKAGKLYSLKPTDGSGDLDVVRATTATYVGSDGLIKTALANEPRIDYTNGSCPSILVEPQRTNLITNSLGYSSGANYTITTNNLSPDGSNNAILATEKTTAGTYIINSVSATVLPSTTYTYSFFVKSNGITTLPINASDGVVANISSVNIITGQVISGSAIVTNYNNGWFRISVTRTTSATASSGFMQCNFGAKTGDGVSGFYLYGFQIEAGSNATSYIPTVGSAVTRNDDVISKTGISDLIGQTEGTIFLDFNITKIDSISRYIYAISNGNSTDFNFEAVINTSNSLILSSRNNATTQVSYNYGVISQQKYKIAYSYSENNTKIFINGVLVSTDTLCTIPTTDSVKLGMRSNYTSYFNDIINSFSIFKTQLTDEQCIALTTL